MKFFGWKGSFLFLGLYIFFNSLFVLMRNTGFGLFMIHHLIFMPFYSLLYFFSSLLLLFYDSKNNWRYKLFDLISACLGPLYLSIIYDFRYHIPFFFLKEGFNSERSIFELVFVGIGLLLISIWYNI